MNSRILRLTPFLLIAVAFIVSGGAGLGIALSASSSDDYSRVERIKSDLRSFEFKTDEILVRTKERDRFMRIRVPKGWDVYKALAYYRSFSNVVYAEPNFVAYAFGTPDDPYYSLQWNLQAGGINAEPAWDSTQGSGVVVAVIDTGVAYEDYRESFFRRYYLAPDLAGTTFVPGYDFVNNDTHPNDDNGHGTHVAGTIAQSTNNSLGVAGVAYAASLMPIKVLNSKGSGSYADVADGIYWAVDNGANIINLSLGGGASSSALEEAVNYAARNNVLVVAAAGNDGDSEISYPARYPAAVAVGATRIDKTLSYYSNFGNDLDVVAPGGDLNVDQNDDGYGDGILQQTFGSRPDKWGYYFYQGTSMASPHVAGVAALVRSVGLTDATQIRSIIETTAEDLGSAGWDSIYGWGLVNADGAVAKALESIGEPLPPPPAPEPEPEPAPEPPPAPEPAYDISITSFTARSVDAGRSSKIKLTIFNNDAAKLSGVADLKIADAGGTYQSWRGIETKNFSIRGEDDKRISWRVRVPKSAVPGTYTASVSLQISGEEVASAQTTFQVLPD